MTTIKETSRELSSIIGDYDAETDGVVEAQDYSSIL